MGNLTTRDSPVLRQLLNAANAGTLSLVDEQNQPLELLDALDKRCWASITDATDGRIYVHGLANSRELLKPAYLNMLGGGV